MLHHSKRLIQRALRFVFVVRRSNWTEEDPSNSNFDSLFVAAKLSTAFVHVYCSVLNLEIESVDLQASKFIPRFEMLLQEAEDCGVLDLPGDTVRTIELADEVPFDLESYNLAQTKKISKQDETAIIASPLCGWKKQRVSVTSPEYVWKDPRECCLCHLCGDDDAGFECLPTDEPDSASEPAQLGRLLPMSDGIFVHTGCALWSSEVWEDPGDGLIHAMEKARCRGSQLKCFGCGRHGATVGCNKGSCIYNYHFPCAKECGAVFTAAQHMYCESHKTTATNILIRENFEHMKPLMIAPEKKVTDDKDSSHVDEDLCSRVGTLVIHSVGKIETKVDGFHSDSYITPPGYVATRIFWSTVVPRTRTVYVLKVENTEAEGVTFSILPSDNPSGKLTGSTASQVYGALLEKVKKVNWGNFSHGNLLSKLPATRKTRRKTFGLNGPQVSSHFVSSLLFQLISNSHHQRHFKSFLGSG